MVRELVAIPVPVRGAAAEPVLFVRPENDANGPARPQIQLFHQPQCLPRHHASAAVVGGSCTDVPGIDVAAEDDDFVRQFASADLADDVEGVGVGEHPRFHREPEPDGRAPCHHPLEPIGVLSGRRLARLGGRAVGDRRVVVGSSRVGRAKAGRADRPDKSRDGAERRRTGRAGGAVADRFSVGGEGDVEEHHLALDPVSGGVELLEAANDQQLSLDALRRRADAAAETEQDESALTWRDDLEALLAAHPVRHFHRFLADVLQAVLLHLLDGPVDRIFERARSAQPVSERVAELRESLPCEV